MSSTTSSSSDSEDNVLIIRTPKVYNAHVTNFDLWTDHEFFERLSKDVTRHVLDHIKDQISAPSNTFRRAILSNPDILSSTSWINLLENDFWGTPLSDSGSHGSYRPFCVFTFRLNYILGGFQPWGYHLVNVLLHVLATGLVVRVARTVLPPGNVGPAMTGLFFASHPIHTEAVAGIVGRADLAACNFYLISFLTYVLHVKYRDNLCLRVFPRVYRYCCDKRQNNIESTKYRNFFNYLRKQVTHVANTTTPNEFCCMRHNFVLPALSTFNTTSRHNIFDVFDDKSSVPSDEKKFCCKCTIPDNLCVVRAVKQWLAFAGCVLCAAGAMLSKETGISVLVVCALYDRIHTSSRGSTKRKNRSLFFLIISLLLLIGLRLYVTSGTTPTFATADNPTSKAASITTRFLTFTYLPCFNFFILLCPISLSFDWSMDAIPRITTIFDSRNIISLFFYFTFYKVLNITYTQLSKQKTKDLKNETNKYRRKELPIFYEAPCPCTVCHHNLFDHHSQICRTNNNNNSLPSSMCLCKRSSPVIQKKDNKLKYPYATILMACAFLALPFLPATNLFFYVGFVVAERVLYLPSVGYCLLVSLGVVRACKYKKYGKFVCFLVVFLLIIFCARTIRRNRDWRDEENLYRSAITINPPKGKLLDYETLFEISNNVIDKVLE